jgi:hypothetical protein
MPWIVPDWRGPPVNQSGASDLHHSEKERDQISVGGRVRIGSALGLTQRRWRRDFSQPFSTNVIVFIASASDEALANWFVDCGQLALRDRKFADSPLEESRFELMVPP